MSSLKILFVQHTNSISIDFIALILNHPKSKEIKNKIKIKLK